MKKIFCLLGILSLLAMSTAWATPPSLIELDYDTEAESLMITVHHKTYDLIEHRIRRLIVYVNDKEIEAFQYIKQPSAEELTQQLSLKVEPGDVIRVKAICSKAGYKEETLVISKKK